MNYQVYRKNKHDRPTGLQISKKQAPTQVFSCGICEDFENSGS